ncbi:MAG TPA: hypothetical protein PLF13_01960 [candidate division Zixibacteria bacterium]|nr:hypothetical protein [candidate division Zixibacteria bacterium]
MKSSVKKLFILATLALLPTFAWGQVDQFSALDTVYAEVGQINETTWTITVSVFNDEYVQALSIPLELHAGQTKIVADSAVYTGGRVEEFTFKGFRADTTIQCVTLGLVANMGPTQNFMPPSKGGPGRVATVFVSSLDGSPIKELLIDTTTTHPNNSLMMIAYAIQFTDPPDTIPQAEAEKLTIVPAFVFKKAE